MSDATGYDQLHDEIAEHLSLAGEWLHIHGCRTCRATGRLDDRVCWDCRGRRVVLA